MVFFFLKRPKNLGQSCIQNSHYSSYKELKLKKILVLIRKYKFSKKYNGTPQFLIFYTVPVSLYKLFFKYPKIGKVSYSFIFFIYKSSKYPLKQKGSNFEDIFLTNSVYSKICIQKII